MCMKIRDAFLGIWGLLLVVQIFAIELIKDKLISLGSESKIGENLLKLLEIEIPIGWALILAIGISIGVQSYVQRSVTAKNKREMNRMRKFLRFVLLDKYTPTVLSTEQIDEITETFKGIMASNSDIAGIQIYEVEHDNSSTDIKFKLNPLVSHTVENSNQINSSLSLSTNNIKDFFDALQSEDRESFYENIKTLNSKAYHSKHLGMYMLLQLLIEDDYKKSYDVVPRVIQVLNDKNKDNRYKQSAKLGLLKGYFSKAVNEELYSFEKMDGSNNKKNRNYVVINAKRDHKYIISIILKNTVSPERKAKVIKKANRSVKRKLKKIERVASS